MAKGKRNKTKAKGKAKTKKLTVKKESVKDLDLSELEARQVKGGTRFQASPRRVREEP